MTEKKIVDAVFVSANSMHDTGMAQKIEAAMSAAVQKCYDAGITDPVEIKTAMMAERQRVKDIFAQADEAARQASEKARAEGMENEPEIAGIMAEARAAVLEEYLG